jgi:hypothetical protein
VGREYRGSPLKVVSYEKQGVVYRSTEKREISVDPWFMRKYDYEYRERGHTAVAWIYESELEMWNERSPLHGSVCIGGKCSEI